MQPKHCVILLLIFCFTTNAQNIKFDQLTIKDGLADNSVRNIIQDDLGYIWFATLNGLSRYDGKNFKTYKSIAGDPFSLNNSRITEIKEDNKGYIWCWSDDKNIQRVNPITNKVIDLKSIIPKEKISVKEFTITKNGDIWLWGNKGCIRIYYKDNSSEINYEFLNKENLIHNEKISFVFEDCKSAIWIGTNEGLIQTKLTEKGVRTIATYYTNSNLLSYKNYKNEIWFGTAKDGIFKFSLKKGKFENLSKINKNLKNNSIRSIVKTDNNHLLVGGSGFLFDINIQNNKVTNINHKELEIITHLFKDSYNNYWLKGKEKGVFKYNLTTKKLHYYNLNAPEREFLGVPDKQVFFEDSNKNLWIGVHGGGLFLYNNSNDQFENYRYDENRSNSISSDVVLSIFEDYSKNLWVGTMHGGVNKINLTKDNFVWTYPVKKKAKNVFENEIRTIIEDNNGDFWMGSKGGKIFHYKNNELVETYPDVLSDENRKKLSNINVYYLHLDNDNNLWIGTKGKGIFVLKDIEKTAAKDLEIVHFNQRDIAKLDKIYSITQDKHGSFWIGTHGYGIIQISNPFENPQISYYNKGYKNKLVSNFIRYLYFDRDDNLWIASSEGIGVLPADQLKNENKTFIAVINNRKNIKSLSFNHVDCIFQASDKTIYAATMGGGINILREYNFNKGIFEWEQLDTSDGISNNKVFSIQEDNQNNLWFSTSLGINKYNPTTENNEIFFVEKEQGLNYFTEGCGLKTNKGELIFGHNRGFLKFDPKEIIKDKTQYPIVLSKLFVNGNQITPDKEGLLKKSINYESQIDLSYLQNSIRLDFSVLDFKEPNKIQFSYKLDGFDNDWSKPLTKNYAIYQNLTPGSYTFLLKATNSDGVYMDNTHTFKIKITPPFYQSKLGYLLGIIILISVVVTFLYQYKKQISAKHKVVLADTLNEKKLKYYTNISHEFKTPLTLILGPVQDILDEENTPNTIIQSALHIKRNAKYLLNLVEQILDFRKINEEKMKLNLSQIEIVSFIKQIHTEFLPLANKEEIELKFESNPQEINGYIDATLIKKVTYNLISNAIKFTPSYKSIEINVALNSDLKTLVIKIIDEGIGIKKKDLKLLFQRFYRSESSSGIGLFYVKELINSHKGTVNVESTYGEGSTFTITLPIEKKAYANDEINENKAVKDITEKPSLVYTPISPEKEVQKHSATLLIIEDNEEMRNYLASKFESYFNILTAENGKKGFDLAVSKIPDFIICDVMMPVMDGIEATKNLRANLNTSHLPIILLTANSSELKKVEGLETGANDYITKPFNFKHLKLKIDTIIAQRKKIIEKFPKDPELPVNVLSNSEQDRLFLEKTKKYIEDNIGKNDFNVDSLASEMGFSRTIFYKKMKSISGVTPLGFISTIQMKKAAILLKNTPHSISEISILVGFNDTNYFSKTFKKHFGKTPKAYQLENRVKEQI